MKKQWKKAKPGSNIPFAILSLLSLILLASCGDRTGTDPGSIPDAFAEADSTADPGAETNGRFPAADVLIDLSEKETSDRQAVQIDGEQFTIGSAGVYRISGLLSDGSITVDADRDAAVHIILDGVDLSCSDGAPLYIRKAGSVTLTLSDNSRNRLSDLGESRPIDRTKVDAALFSKTDLTIDGNGSLTVIRKYQSGITSKDSLSVKGGSITVDASGHALEANDSITIDKGSLSLTAGKDAIHSENNDDPSLGMFTINGGSISINAEDDAIHAVNSLTVNGGTLNIERSLEGLEAAQIYIKGGSIFVNALDDGINATVGAETDCFNGEAVIAISGGQTEIVTQGDGLDSNGDILISGGEVIIHGPGRNQFGYGALDYVNKAEISGGRFIALTVIGKAFSESSTQASFNLNLSEMIGSTAFELKSSDGTVLVSETSELPLNSVIVSIPELTVGGSYTAKVGGSETTIQQRSITVKVKAALPVPDTDVSDTRLTAQALTVPTLGTVNYLLYTPADAKADMPLIVYLHGAGGRGDDLSLLTQSEGLPKLFSEGRVDDVPAYIVFPQLSSEFSDWVAARAELMSFIDAAVQRYGIDKNRVSLTGYSLGGTAVWRIAAYYPEVFSCIAPLSGSIKATDDTIARLKGLKIRAFVGSADDRILPEYSIDFVEAFKAAGGWAELTVFDGASHAQVPALTYTDPSIALLEWLCSNSRAATAGGRDSSGGRTP